MSPFQKCMTELERIARQMWADGVDGKTLHQPAYLWPMTTALKQFEEEIRDE